MKTKIIYISGNEVFNMADVRNALDTVRRELGLAKDVILFGVPVDSEDALGGQFDSVPMVESEPVIMSEDEKIDVIHEKIPVVQDVIQEEFIEEPVKVKAKSKRAKKVSVESGDEVDTSIKDDVEQDVSEKIIPILSVLGNETIQSEAEDKSDVEEAQKVEPCINKTINAIDDDIDFMSQPDVLDESDTFEISDTDNFQATNEEEDIATVEPEITTINDADDDDGLEKLLQSVKSLHEDEKPELKVIENDEMLDETDATLEQLATEFVENQDKIVNTTKSTARSGKIGKLKNILPFKKAKHNESSLMGDLFGWAGVAANDEDFGIPEFFPTAVKK